MFGELVKRGFGLNIYRCLLLLFVYEHRAQSTEHRAQSTEHRAQSTEHGAWGVFVCLISLILLVELKVRLNTY